MVMLDDGHASATVDFGVRNGILNKNALAPAALALICACALGACIYDV